MIKYRVWDNRQKTYQSNSGANGYQGNNIWFIKVEDYEKLELYTGIKDVNGKEIFDGDIIKVPDDYDTFGYNAGEVYRVYFAFGGFRLKPKYSENAKGYYLEDDKEVMLLGNIHENGELLK